MDRPTKDIEQDAREAAKHYGAEHPELGRLLWELADALAELRAGIETEGGQT